MLQKFWKIQEHWILIEVLKLEDLTSTVNLELPQHIANCRK